MGPLLRESFRLFGALVLRYFFFFFQAEDGIRDLTVTGVQTCALPICRRRPQRHHHGIGVELEGVEIEERHQHEEREPRDALVGVEIAARDLPGDPRSEEHTSELQSQSNLVCRLLLEKKKNTRTNSTSI